MELDYIRIGNTCIVFFFPLSSGFVVASLDFLRILRRDVYEGIDVKDQTAVQLSDWQTQRQKKYLPVID